MIVVTKCYSMYVVYYFSPLPLMHRDYISVFNVANRKCTAMKSDCKTYSLLLPKSQLAAQRLAQ